MGLDLILKNCRFVAPEGIIEGDIGIENGAIVALGKVAAKAKSERDLSGLFVLPGLIDMHVHMRDPGFPKKEDFRTGTMAAARGGVTTVIDMPNTQPPVTTTETLEEKRQLVASKSLVNFGFYMALAEDNLDEIEKAQNIAGVKVWLGPSTGNLVIPQLGPLEKLFEKGIFVVVHAEDAHLIEENGRRLRGEQSPSIHSEIRSPEAAFEAVRKVLHLAKKYDARVHITHVSTAIEVEEFKKFRSPKVTADATPHHLYLTTSAYAALGNCAKVNPPLREERDRAALWRGLKEGLITAIASDHAPHTMQEKRQPYEKAPAGIPGLETMLPLLLDSVNHGELSLEDVARLTAENPARILNIAKKGHIEVEGDADLVVVDMNAVSTVGEKGFATKCQWSPFTGRTLKGWPVMTIVGGTIVFGNGLFNEKFCGKEVRFKQTPQNL